jgi:hypothetical protein
MRLAAALTLVLAAASEPAWPAGRLDAETMKAYGGTYRSDCKDLASPSFVVGETSLTYVKGDKRITGSILPEDETAAWFGQIPPDGFHVALQSVLPDGESFALLVYQDARGPYLTVEADEKLAAVIGKAAMARQYRLCDAASRPAPAVQAPIPASPDATPADEFPDSDGMMRDPAFRAAYLKALGRFAKEPWLAQMNGRSGATSKVTVAGKEYLQVNFCKLHDCGASNTTVLYSASRKLVYGKVSIEGKTALIGSPPPEVAKALGELWRTQWVHDH